MAHVNKESFLVSNCGYRHPTTWFAEVDLYDCPNDPARHQLQPEGQALQDIWNHRYLAH